MRILLVGCEYVGTTTLAKELYRWGAEEMGADFGLFHDHWKIPNVTGHWPIDTDSFMAEDEQEGLLALAPKVKEQMQRHSLYYHIQPGAFRKGHEEEQGFYSDYLAVGMHIEDSVYGPLYFDYGADGQPGARSIVKKTVERALLEAAPDFVLVLMEASQDTIRSRMKADPHPRQVVREADVEHVLNRFREEYELSTIPNRLTLDTTSATVEETLAESVEKIEPFLSSDDIARRERHLCRSQG
jgi:hypothetical protein